MSSLRKLLPPATVCAAASAFVYDQSYGQKKDAPICWQDRSERIQGYDIYPARQDKEIRAAAAIERYMAVSGTPGLSVGVTVNSQMVWSEGFGFADVETGARCNGQSVMRIASISKPITAAIAARLIEKDQLDIDKPIQDYLKDRKGDKKNGNADADPNEANKSTDPEYLSKRTYASVTEALDMFKNDPLVAKPGSKFYYTTHGFTLISAVLEAASGKKFPELAEDLFHELGLSNTRLDKNLPIVPNRTRYYRRNEKTHLLENVPEVDNSYKWAGGAFKLLRQNGHVLSYSRARWNACGVAKLPTLALVRAPGMV
ncbi:Protein LACT-9 a [Aphelenchoides avenae]|nr:Protein LACT-9 a [Aphelenchus avenae]